EGGDFQERAFQILEALAYQAWKDSLDASDLADPWLARAEAHLLFEDIAAWRRAWRQATADLEAADEEIEAEFAATRDAQSLPERVLFRYLFLEDSGEEAREREIGRAHV